PPTTRSRAPAPPRPRPSPRPASSPPAAPPPRPPPRRCAAVARYRPRDRQFLRTSRLTVDGARPSRAAITRTPSPAASPTAISSRSASDRYRPLTGPAPFPFTPPAARNHNAPPRRNPPPPPRHPRPPPPPLPPQPRPHTLPEHPPRLTRRPHPTPVHHNDLHPQTKNRCDHRLNPPLLIRHGSGIHALRHGTGGAAAAG